MLIVWMRFIGPVTDKPLFFVMVWVVVLSTRGCLLQVIDVFGLLSLAAHLNLLVLLLLQG